MKITAGPASIRQGDVHQYAATVRDKSGAELPASLIRFELLPPESGLVMDDGRLVSYSTGSLRLVAAVREAGDTLVIQSRPRGLSGSFEIVGHGQETDRFTSDLWVHGGYAYLGSWSCRGRSPAEAVCGNRLTVWDVRNPSVPVLVDSVLVDAQTVNDVKVSADGRVAVITHEGSSDRLNGITLLDLADPARPLPITRYTEGLEGGVHNVWIEDDLVYVASDGISGLHVANISDPAMTVTVFTRPAESSFLHDVYVRQGLLFLAHWDDGLIILDVSGGFPTPEEPLNAMLAGADQEVARIVTEGGQVHNVWFWPEAGYAFVGEENVAAPGVMHVVDLRDMSRPREVATFRLPGATPHNFWMDEERGILYAAWYQQGVRAIDVTGELLGELDRQGREIASSLYAGTGNCPRDGSSLQTCTWAPQLEDGLIYASDLNTGLWVLRPDF